MKLQDFLDRKSLSYTVFAKMTGYRLETVRRWANGTRHPEKIAMPVIERVTKGWVKPADFYKDVV